VKTGFPAVKGNHLAVVLGGARSGKSAWAEELARRAAERGRRDGEALPVTYVATATVDDEEMARRVEAHRRRRPASWRTVEAPFGLAETIRDVGRARGVILVDCLTVYVSNVLLQAGGTGAGESVLSEHRERTVHQHVLGEVEAFVEACRNVPAHVIVVTNEVGEGVVPAYPLGRLFRDVAGRANQMIARAADDVYVLFAGIPVEVKRLSAVAADRLQHRGGE